MRVSPGEKLIKMIKLLKCTQCKRYFRVKNRNYSQSFCSVGCREAFRTGKITVSISTQYILHENSDEEEVILCGVMSEIESKTIIGALNDLNQGKYRCE